MSLKYQPSSEPGCGRAVAGPRLAGRHPDLLSSSSLTSLLTSDDTREAHSFLKSDQLLTWTGCGPAVAGPRLASRHPDRLRLPRAHVRADVPRSTPGKANPGKLVRHVEGRERC